MKITRTTKGLAKLCQLGRHLCLEPTAALVAATQEGDVLDCREMISLNLCGVCKRDYISLNNIYVQTVLLYVIDQSPSMFREALGRLRHVSSHGNFVYVGSGTILTKISLKKQLNLLQNPSSGALMQLNLFSWNWLLTKPSKRCYRFDAKVMEETGVQAMRCCQLLWVFKNYPWCLNLISECSRGTSNLGTHHFRKLYPERDAHLQRVQANHQHLGKVRGRGEPRQFVCLTAAEHHPA